MTKTSKKTGAEETEEAPVRAKGPPELGPLADFIGFHLRLAQEASFHAFARHVGATDLRPGRFAVLALIGENPGISQTVLGRVCGRDKSSLTPALDDLERRGLIARERLVHDRRSYALSLTPAGRETLDELMTHAKAHDRELDRIVGLENKEAFLRTLRRLIAALS